MTDEEIKAAAERVFDSLFNGVEYKADQPKYEESAILLTKIFRNQYTQLIEEAIRGKA